MVCVNSLDSEAIQRGSDIYFVGFKNDEAASNPFYPKESGKLNDPLRVELMQWLNDLGIGYYHVGPKEESGWLIGGPLYLGIEMQPGDDGNYAKVCEFLETPSGIAKRSDMLLYVLRLDEAKQATPLQAGED